MCMLCYPDLIIYGEGSVAEREAISVLCCVKRERKVFILFCYMQCEVEVDSSSTMIM